MTKQTFKDFLVEYYADDKKHKDDDPCKKIKNEKERKKCEKKQDHEELVDFITKATATNN